MPPARGSNLSHRVSSHRVVGHLIRLCWGLVGRLRDGRSRNPARAVRPCPCPRARLRRPPTTRCSPGPSSTGRRRNDATSPEASVSPTRRPPRSSARRVTGATAMPGWVVNFANTPARWNVTLDGSATRALRFGPRAMTMAHSGCRTGATHSRSSTPAPARSLRRSRRTCTAVLRPAVHPRPDGHRPGRSRTVRFRRPTRARRCRHLRGAPARRLRASARSSRPTTYRAIAARACWSCRSSVQRVHCWAQAAPRPMSDERDQRRARTARLSTGAGAQGRDATTRARS